MTRLPPAQRKVAELLKPGDLVTHGGSTRYIVREIRHQLAGGKWQTTIVQRQAWNYPHGFDGYWQGARVERGFVLTDYPGGCVTKLDGGA